MPDLSQMTERQSSPSARSSDINLNLVREHINTTIKRRGYDGPTEPDEYLIEYGFLLRNDSVCVIDIAQFSGSRQNMTDLVRLRKIRGDRISIIVRGGQAQSLPAAEVLSARALHRTLSREGHTS